MTGVMMAITFLGTKDACLDRAVAEGRSNAARLVYRRVGGGFEVHDAPTADPACVYWAHVSSAGNGRAVP
jgi:hypothetical protein